VGVAVFQAGNFPAQHFHPLAHDIELLVQRAELLPGSSERRVGLLELFNGLCQSVIQLAKILHFSAPRAFSLLVYRATALGAAFPQEKTHFATLPSAE
jgi:hypothetical protein